MKKKSFDKHWSFWVVVGIMILWNIIVNGSTFLESPGVFLGKIAGTFLLLCIVFWIIWKIRGK